MASPGGEETTFKRAARALASALASGAGLPGPEYLVVRAGLVNLLPAAERTRSDTEEIVDATLEAFCAHATRGEIDAERAASYLATSLRSARVDSYRREARVTAIFPVDEAALTDSDDAIFRLLDREAAREDVYAALSAAFRDRRATTVKVVLRWIGLAERTGKEPTLREVAEAAQASHTTVEVALHEIRTKYLGRPL